MEKAGPKGKGFIPKLVGNLIFKALDKNGDGVLDGDEAFGLFKNMGNKNQSESNKSTAPEQPDYPDNSQNQPSATSSNNNKYY